MKNDELKQRIEDLKDATDTLTKLRHLSKSLTCSNVQSEQRTVATYATFLQRVQEYAGLLHSEISHRLISGCHQEHEIRLYLENRVSILQKQRGSVNFRLILTAPSASTGGSQMSPELQVAVLDDDNNECDPRGKSHQDLNC